LKKKTGSFWGLFSKKSPNWNERADDTQVKTTDSIDVEVETTSQDEFSQPIDAKIQVDSEKKRKYLPYKQELPQWNPYLNHHQKNLLNLKKFK
jgi:hypothetical protein